MLSYIFKKNIRFNYLKDKSQGADDANLASRFGELNLVYDLSPEQTYLKLFIRPASTQQGQKKVHLDLVCNEFEYEILYKRAFSGDNLDNQDPFNLQQARHKRGYSQGNYSGAIGGANSSPAANMNLFGSPAANMKQQTSLPQQDIQGLNLNFMSPIMGLPN